MAQENKTGVDMAEERELLAVWFSCQWKIKLLKAYELFFWKPAEYRGILKE